jgi:hypothetical protein
MLERKSIKELAWDVDEETYRASEAVSYSTLSMFAREGAKCIPHLKDKKNSEALRFGSLTDTLMTEPELLNDKFVIAEFNKPTEVITKIITNIWDKSDKTNNNLSKVNHDIILMYINEENYYTNWKDTTRINKIIEEGQSYFELLALCDGKTLMSQNDYNRAQQCIEVLKTHPFTSKFFYDNPFDTDTEAFYQLKFRIIGSKLSIRCMFDRVIVNHKEKTIQPIDLKTTGKPEEEFEHSFTAWRYDLQATMYSYILRKICSEDEYFKDFEILPFMFICINRYNQKPLCWIYKDSKITGDRISIDGTLYKGWYNLLTEFNWHIESGKIDYSFASYQANGQRDITNLFLKN